MIITLEEAIFIRYEKILKGLENSGFSLTAAVIKKKRKEKFYFRIIP